MGYREAVKGLPGDVVTAAAGIKVVKTYSALAMKEHIIDQVILSYSGDPTGGRLRIEDDSGMQVFKIDIFKGGVVPITFTPPIHGTINKDMILTLAAGGAGITGKLNIRHR